VRTPTGKVKLEEYAFALPGETPTKFTTIDPKSANFFTDRFDVNDADHRIRLSAFAAREAHVSGMPNLEGLRYEWNSYRRRDEKSPMFEAEGIMDANDGSGTKGLVFRRSVSASRPNGGSVGYSETVIFHAKEDKAAGGHLITAIERQYYDDTAKEYMRIELPLSTPQPFNLTKVEDRAKLEALFVANGTALQAEGLPESKPAVVTGALKPTATPTVTNAPTAAPTKPDADAKPGAETPKKDEKTEEKVSAVMPSLGNAVQVSSIDDVVAPAMSQFKKPGEQAQNA
jgi:hypothetical protein